MAKQSVTAFLETLEHPRKAEIERLRAIILAADPTLGEQIKWNAPSFGRNGEDRITFRLQPGDKVDLIFHRGAKVKDTDGLQLFRSRRSAQMAGARSRHPGV